MPKLLIKLAAIINYITIGLFFVIAALACIALFSPYWTLAVLLGTVGLELVLVLGNGLLILYLEKKFGI